MPVDSSQALDLERDVAMKKMLTRGKDGEWELGELEY